MLTVIGGTYREVCLSPSWGELWGSGFRAAVALLERVPSIQFFTYGNRDDKKHLNNYAKDPQNSQFSIHCTHRDYAVEWQYDHSASAPRLQYSHCNGKVPPKIVLGSNRTDEPREGVLLFSFIETSAFPEFSARQAVYDPQAGHRATRFSHESCKVEKLSIVLNLVEARAIAYECGVDNIDKMGPKTLAQEILLHERAECVVVKNGIFGAHVATGAHSSKHIPAYKTDSYFGIGSGDIFSAVFSALWMEEGCEPFNAAETAAAATAWYCSNPRILPLPSGFESLASAFEPIDLDRIRKNGAPKQAGVGMIYLAGPFFTLSQKWLINQALEQLNSMGLQVWSPSLESGILHESSTLEDVERVVEEDLAALRRCKSVFACVESMDPGTMFEIGYAHSLGIPVTVYAENMRNSDPTMLDGTRCAIFEDFASAVAHAITVAFEL